MEITLTYAAEQIGISQGYLSNILRGRRRPSPEVALAISTKTQTPLEIWLFKSKENLSLRQQSIKKGFICQTKDKPNL